MRDLWAQLYAANEQVKDQVFAAFADTYRGAEEEEVWLDNWEIEYTTDTIHLVTWYGNWQMNWLEIDIEGLRALVAS